MSLNYLTDIILSFLLYMKKTFVVILVVLVYLLFFKNKEGFHKSGRLYKKKNIRILNRGYTNQKQRIQILKNKLRKCIETKRKCRIIKRPNKIIYGISFNKNLYAIDSTSNILKWDITPGGRISSSPTVSNDSKTVYIISNNNTLYAIDVIAGNTKWTFQTSDPIISAPAMDISDTVIYVISNSNIYAIDAENGYLRWRKSMT